MITKDQFIEFIYGWKQHAKDENSYEDILNFDGEFFSWYLTVADLVVTSNFSKRAANIIFWYLYGKEYNPSKYDVANEEELWDIAIKITNEDSNI